MEATKSEAIPFILEDSDFLFDLDLKEGIVMSTQQLKPIKGNMGHFQEGINHFYNTYINELRMHPSSYRKNQVCAVKVSNNWYRAITTSKPINFNYSEVLLVDLNMKIKTNIEKAQYLSDMYAY